jgi:hypothetical protein
MLLLPIQLLLLFLLCVITVYYYFLISILFLYIRQISAIGSSVFASLVGLIPPLPLMQRLCTIATHDKDRMRCAALKAIAAYLAKSDTPLDTHLLQRYGMPCYACLYAMHACMLCMLVL